MAKASKSGWTARFGSTDACYRINDVTEQAVLGMCCVQHVEGRKSSGFETFRRYVLYLTQLSRRGLSLAPTAFLIIRRLIHLSLPRPCLKPRLDHSVITPRQIMENNATVEQFLLLAKAARGHSQALVELITKATAEPGLFTFGELLSLPSVQEVKAFIP